MEFTDELCEYEMSKERLLRGDVQMGSTLMSVEPLNEPSFVSVGGKETITVSPGAYGCQLKAAESRQYAFRFFLDFPEGAKRNDVELPPERIYFLSSCWLADEAAVERARERKAGIEESLRQVQSELTTSQTRPGGVWQKVTGFRRQMDLIERKDRLVARAEELAQAWPLDPAEVVRGPHGVAFAREGFVAVKRLRGTLGTSEQYHWVGSFTYNDFFEDE